MAEQVRMSAETAYNAYVSGIPGIKAQIEEALKNKLVTAHYINPNPPEAGKKRAKIAPGFMAFLTANKLTTNVPGVRQGGFGGGEVSTFITANKTLAPLKEALDAAGKKFNEACTAAKLNLGVQIAYKRDNTTLTVDGKPAPKVEAPVVK